MRFLGIIVLCSVPCTAWAQPWADAYRAGDYRKAVDLLEPLVIGVEPLPADPEPARHLAMLYAQGLGVARDAALACAMAQTAASAPVARPSTPDGAARLQGAGGRERPVRPGALRRPDSARAGVRVASERVPGFRHAG